MIKEDNRKFVATALTIYTMLIFISLCLLLVSVEVCVFFTTIWFIFTFIILFGVGLSCLTTLLLNFYEKLLGKGKK